jgi:hypothetical protein
MLPDDGDGPAEPTDRAALLATLLQHLQPRETVAAVRA